MEKDNKVKKEEILRLNFGSAHDHVKGFRNVDGLDWDGNTDFLWNITAVPYPLDTESVEEIRSIETLEHISFRDTSKVLSEWHRILKVGAKVTIGVPAVDKMCEMYVNKEICQCIPHKIKRMKDLVPDPECYYCKGKGKVNPTRWLMAFCGAQKHRLDQHLNVFTKENLEEYLKNAGFKDISISYEVNDWKLKAKALK